MILTAALFVNLRGPPSYPAHHLSGADARRGRRDLPPLASRGAVNFSGLLLNVAGAYVLEIAHSKGRYHSLTRRARIFSDGPKYDNSLDRVAFQTAHTARPGL